MADISVTAANVARVDGVTQDVTAGATITAGQLVYKDTSDSNEHKPIDADVEASAVIAGVALNGAADGQPVRILTTGNLNPGGTAVVGEVYCASTNSGGIAAYGDLATGDYVSVLGIATTASNIKIAINNSGIVKP